MTYPEGSKTQLFRDFLYCSDGSVQPPYFDVADIEDIFHDLIRGAEYKEVEALLDYADNLHPGEQTISELNIELLLDRGKAKEALALLQKIGDTSDQMVLTYYISAYAQLGKKNLADAYADKICKSPDFNPVDGYYNIAVSFQEANQYQDALHYFLLAEKYDKSPDLLLDIANCYVSLSDLSKALQYVDNYIKSDPYSSEAWEMKAEICLSMQMPADALSAANYALVVNPQNVNPLLYKLTAQLMLKDTNAAEDTVQQILNRSNTPATYCIIGGIYSEQGLHQKSMDFFDKSDVEQTDELPLIKTYCEALLGINSNERLIIYLSSREGLFEEEEVLLTLLVEAYINIGQTDQAIELCRKHYHLLAARVSLISLYLDTNQPDKALEIAQENLDMNPNIANLLFAAEAAWLSKQPVLCKQYLDKAQKLEPTSLKVARTINEEMVNSLGYS